MCKVHLNKILQDRTAIKPQEQRQEMSATERERIYAQLRLPRKTLLLEKSILRRLGPDAKLNLNLHWGYLERVMVKKENLPPLYYPPRQ